MTSHDDLHDHRDACYRAGAADALRDALASGVVVPASRVEEARAERVALSANIRGISAAISGSYPADLDPEAHLWRRCMKVTEEAGEVFKALAGLLGENPRKGRTHTNLDLRDELLDVAGAALGAASHLGADNANVDPVALLAEHLEFVHARLRAALTSTAMDAPEGGA